MLDFHYNELLYGLREVSLSRVVQFFFDENCKLFSAITGILNVTACVYEPYNEKPIFFYNSSVEFKIFKYVSVKNGNGK